MTTKARKTKLDGSLMVEYKIKAVKTSIPFESSKIESSDTAYQYAVKLYESTEDNNYLVRESSYALFLNQSNRILGHAKLSEGGVSATIIDTILVAKFAVETLSKAVILVHNHPSGSTQPSNQDKVVTSSVKNALQLFNIALLDHIIVADTEGKYLSMADEGEI